MTKCHIKKDVENINLIVNKFFGTVVEVDASLLDEGVAEVLLGYRTLARDTDLQAAQVAQSHNFATLQGFGNHIFQCHEHGEYVAFVHGTSLLDAFGHFADVDVARCLYVSVEFRSRFLVARVDTRGYRISYISSHSLVKFLKVNS